MFAEQLELRAGALTAGVDLARLLQARISSTDIEEICKCTAEVKVACSMGPAFDQYTLRFSYPGYVSNSTYWRLLRSI